MTATPEMEFGTSYDWERIDELLQRVARLSVRLPAEVAAFQAFLGQLMQEQT